MKSIEGFDDSIVAILALHALEKGLVSQSVKDFWIHLATKDSLQNGNWLVAYEGNIQGWLKSTKEKNYIESDENFVELKLNDISFYNKQTDFFATAGRYSSYEDAEEWDGDEDDD